MARQSIGELFPEYTRPSRGFVGDPKCHALGDLAWSVRNGRPSTASMDAARCRDLGVSEESIAATVAGEMRSLLGRMREHGSDRMLWRQAKKAARAAVGAGA